MNKHLIVTHGRRPESMDNCVTTAQFPKASFVTIWHCGRPACVHPTAEDALAHIHADRKTQHDPTK